MTDRLLQEQLAIYWWEKAEKSLESATREFGAGEYDFSINRLYYAAFYAVSAVLMKRNLAFRKHSGVRGTFHREFIKTGLLDVKWGRLYDQLFEDRQESDYTALVEFEKDYVEDQLKRCGELLKLLRYYAID